MTQRPDGKTKKKNPGPKVNKLRDRELAKLPKIDGGEAFRLDEIDHQILKHLMEFPEATWKELGLIVDRNPRTVQARYRKPSFQNALKDLRAKTWDLVERAQNMAIRRLMKLIQSKDERIALDAAKYVLQPMVNTANVNVQQFQEMVYKADFGENGQIITSKAGVESAPENTLDLVIEE